MPRKVSALAPWFGSNRLLAPEVGKRLAGCKWVGIPFAGGMCELPHIKAPTVLVNDLHAHVVNLARVVKDDRERLVEAVEALPFHPAVLKAAQERCQLRDLGMPPPGDHPLNWAADYFVCAWMARSATAGTGDEFEAGLSTRWTATGGDSVVRFRNAAAGLADWQAAMKRCTFTTLDWRDFMREVRDARGHGVYADPPFPGPGKRYKHSFDDGKHLELARGLGALAKTAVVARFYDVPLVRELYPEGRWRWHRLAGGRKQSNAAAPEVLICNEAAP